MNLTTRERKDHLYYEYPIRCYSCNELVDCRVDEFLELVQTGMDAQEALNAMSVFAICTREKFLNPSPIHYNMENKLAIEGRIRVTPELRPSTEETQARAIKYGSTLTGRSEVREEVEVDFNPEGLRPTIVGIPVINRRADRAEIKVNAGAGRSSVFINGRQYLCD